ncbi:tetratricopeptide repeat protein [Actinomadura geliboluensis]|uniref:Tetratricopeptide repeat protein n=1 Tax=Actinomadura geliboluensis TaxID=882440 RepID=A0A5S4GH51_9ACTN|nr:tetratricopeptide repeat protein [Actinomadura geliboluensis]TMR25540.1 tetratricopeptide repeat protein [Actinomadura geliboluensis]
MDTHYEVSGEGRQYNAPHGTINVNEAPGSPRLRLFTVYEAPELIGRQEEIENLVTRIVDARASGRPVVLSAVSGMPGVGKTVLARAAAARLANAFPDARLEVDLLGFTPGENPRTADDALTELLSLAGFTQIPAGVAAKSGLWRAWLAERSVLLLLDSARSYEQIGPLCPAANSGGSVVLITSRNTLSDVPGAIRLPLDLLSRSAAVDMLIQGSGLAAGQVTEDPWEELAEACGRLPLVLRPISHLLQDNTPRTVLEVLREHQNRLTGLPDIDQSVRAAFEVSFTALPDHLQKFLLACARHPGPDFDARSLSALTGTSVPTARLRLSDLHRHAMIIREGARYTLHDLFLAYARDQTSHAPEATRIARDGLYRRLADTTQVATSILTETFPDDTSLISPGDARPWLTAATNELRAAAQTALTERSPHARELLLPVCLWLLLNNRYDQATALYAQARDLFKQSGDWYGQATALAGLGEIARLRSDYEQAQRHSVQALNLYKRISDGDGQAAALIGLGEIAWLRTDYEQAERYYTRAHDLCEQVENQAGQADALRGLGELARRRLAIKQAKWCYAQARNLYKQVGSRLGEANTLNVLGHTALMCDGYEQAEHYFTRAHDLYEQFENQAGQAGALNGLGDAALIRNFYEQAKRRDSQAHNAYEQAKRCYTRANHLYEQIGDRLGQAHVALRRAQLAEAQGERQSASVLYAVAAQKYRDIQMSHRMAHCEGKSRALKSDEGDEQA